MCITKKKGTIILLLFVVFVAIIFIWWFFFFFKNQPGLKRATNWQPKNNPIFPQLYWGALVTVDGIEQWTPNCLEGLPHSMNVQRKWWIVGCSILAPSLQNLTEKQLALDPSLSRNPKKYESTDGCFTSHRNVWWKVGWLITNVVYGFAMSSYTTKQPHVDTIVKPNTVIDLMGCYTEHPTDRVTEIGLLLGGVCVCVQQWYYLYQ